MSEIVNEGISPVKQRALLLYDNIRELVQSKKEGSWGGELPLEEVTPEAVFNAADNLLSAYDGDSSGTYPVYFYLADGETRLGIRYVIDTNETALEVVKQHGMGSGHHSVFQLAKQESGEFTLWSVKESSIITEYSEANAVLQVFADVIGGARWDFVFGSDARHDQIKDSVSMLKESFVARQERITDAQNELDADLQMFKELEKYHGSELAATLLMQSRVRLGGVDIALTSDAGNEVDRHSVLAEVLGEFARNAGAVALSDPELQIHLRVLSDLKRPLTVNVKNDDRLLRWSQKFHHVYNGVAEPTQEA